MPRSAPPIRSLPLYVFAAGAVAGTLDILYAIGFWSFKGVPAARILQSIAAGVKGKDAFTGGGASAALGLTLHYLIAIGMAAAFALVARYRWPGLLARPVRYGLLYGLLLYALMTYVVVPLSAAPGGGGGNALWIGCSLVAHAVLVGLPIALIVRRAFGGGTPARMEAVGAR